MIDGVFIWCPQYRLMAFSFLSPERLLGLVEEVDVGWEVEFLQLLLLPPEQHSFLKVMCHEICYLYFFLQNTLPGPHMNRLKRFLELFCFHHQWPTWGWGIPPVTYLGLRYEYHHQWPPGVKVSPPLTFTRGWSITTVTYNWGRGITTSDLPGVEVSQPVTYSYLGLRYPHQWPAWGWGIPTSDLYLGLRYLWSTSAGGGWGGWYRAWHNVSSPSNLKLKS